MYWTLTVRPSSSWTAFVSASRMCTAPSGQKSIASTKPSIVTCGGTMFSRATSTNVVTHGPLKPSSSSACSSITLSSNARYSDPNESRMAYPNSPARFDRLAEARRDDAQEVLRLLLVLPLLDLLAALVFVDRLQREVDVAFVRVDLQDLADDLLTLAHVVPDVLDPARADLGDVNEAFLVL